MKHHWHDELLSAPAPAGAPSVPTALVVDDSFTARARVAMLLELGGWRVHQAVGTEDALRLAALIEPDLVVTEMVMRNGHGATLMRRLREQGSTARFLVVASRRTHQCRALAAGAGALACLLKPVDPRLFVDVMRGLAPAAVPTAAQDTASAPAAEAWGHTEEAFFSALPHRLSTVAVAAQAGDASAVAAAADSLAVAADRLGHTEVTFLGQAIARDARRGMVSHGRLVALVELCARLDSRRELAGQALRSA
jgi:CheY-like chemotaxis protein